MTSDTKTSDKKNTDKKNTDKKNTDKKRSDIQLNIGIIMFGVIFLYLVVTIFRYFTDEHITVYEVRHGSILKDDSYTGLILREETVVSSADDGFINFYVPDCSKVKVGSDIYTLSDDKIDFYDNSNEGTNDEQEFTASKEQAIVHTIQQFNYDYNTSDFAEVYRLKNDIRDSLNMSGSFDKLSQLNAILSRDSTNHIQLHATSDDGVVVYTIDGMEHLTEETATISDLDRTHYKAKQILDNTSVKSGQPIYKLITDDSWTLMIEIDDDTAKNLADSKYVKLNILKDDQTLWAYLDIEKQDGHNLAYLTFENGMIRYATERFLDIKLIMQDQTGLKIPKSARTEKTFFVVPKEYMTKGGENNANGFLMQTQLENGGIGSQFVETKIYYEDQNFYYVDTDNFALGTTFKMTESNSTYTLSEKKTLDGVFLINRGYAIFKHINILCESDSYYIVEDETDYGLSNYDHIALDSTGIQVNDVVF